MFYSASDIILEVNRQANELNYQVQLFALELYQKEYFKPKHFSGNDFYSNLHKEKHRLNKRKEEWIDLYGIENLQHFVIRKEQIELKIEELKLERQSDRDSFILNFLSDKLP